MQYIGEFVTTITLIVINMIAGGFTVSVLWGWFMVPILNAPVLSISGAIGISLVARILCIPVAKGPELEKPFYLALAKNTFRTVGIYAVLLLYGWIIRAFM